MMVYLFIGFAVIIGLILVWMLSGDNNDQEIEADDDQALIDRLERELNERS